MVRRPIFIVYSFHIKPSIHKTVHMPNAIHPAILGTGISKLKRSMRNMIIGMSGSSKRLNKPSDAFLILFIYSFPPFAVSFFNLFSFFHVPEQGGFL